MATNGLTDMTIQQLLYIATIFLFITTVTFGVLHHQSLQENTELLELVESQHETIVTQREISERLVKNLQYSVNLTDRVATALNRCVDELESESTSTPYIRMNL